MNTLEKQRQRLLQEVHQAEIQLSILRRKTYFDLSASNQYQDLIMRNRNLLAMIDDHLRSRARHCESRE